MTRRYSSSMGRVEGSIMATIMMAHTPIKASAAVGPRPIIHIMDMVQLPGILMPPDMSRA